MKKDKEKVIQQYMKKGLKDILEERINSIIGIYRLPRYRQILSSILKTKKRILNVGAGDKTYEVCGGKLGKNVINLDIQKYPNIDIVCDVCEKIDAPSNSFDAVLVIALIEHLRDPYQAVREIYRVLKKGGVIFSVSPFIFKYHPYPYDYQRLTLDGLDRLYEKFEKIESGIIAGPTSSFRHILANYLSLFTFSSSRHVNNIVRSLVYLFTFPFKWLDLLLVKNKNSEIIAGSYYYYALKK